MKKLQETINYIIDCFQRTDSISKLGKVKLAKILWFADKEFMYQYSKSITNTEYIKLPNGPVPKKFDNILAQMEKEGIIHKIEMSLFNSKKQICYTSLQKPNLKSFEPQEIQVLDSVIYELKNKKAKKLSELTHDSLWESANNGDIMPVESVFLRDLCQPTQEDIKWAMDIANKVQGAN